MFTCLLKAAVAVAVSPVAVVADAVMMPGDAAEGNEFAPRTSALLRAAGRNIAKAVSEDEE